MISAEMRNIDTPWKISWLESIAICEGMRSISVNDFPIISESDSLQVVRLLCGEEDDLTELGDFDKEAKCLILTNKVDSIIYTPRAHNQMAHYLAYRACEENGSIYWVNSFPNWLLTNRYLLCLSP